MQKTFVLNRTGGLEGVDFRALGFKCGLEIHHQIKTEKKLFCRCPAGKYSEEYQSEVLRHMRPTLSELGEYDGCALMEFKTKKEIIYRLNKESVCTYELDDNPPFPINCQALEIAIEIALLLNCKIVSEIHISRKQYLDGSIPAGFQRTTIVGVEGWIPYKGRKIGIKQLALEEDACREVSDIRHRITFLTDRLSMPLIEVVTAADMLDPVEAAEVGGIIGTLLRITRKVNRGVGAVRQDVNVSINGGERVEIKGVPKLGYIPRLTGFEATRQKALLELRDEMHRRGFRSEGDITAEIKDVSDIVGEIEHPPLKKRLSEFKTVKAVCLRGLGGIFSYQLNPGWNLAHEVSGRLRVIACLDKMPNIAHTDTNDEFALSKSNIIKVLRWFKCNPIDTVVLVWGTAEDVETGVNEVLIRVREILQGVINETRQRRPDGTTDFERILPGPNRMYPDTDSPPTCITDEMIERIRANLPETPWVKQERFMKLGLSADIAWQLLHSPYLEVFESAVERFPKQAGLFVQLVLQYIVSFCRRNGFKLDGEEIRQYLNIIGENSLCKDASMKLLSVRKEYDSWNDALLRLELEYLPDSQVDETLQQVWKEFRGMNINSNAVIGEAKQRLPKIVSGKRIYERWIRIKALGSGL